MPRKRNQKSNKKSKPKRRNKGRTSQPQMSIGGIIGDSLQKLAVSTFKRITGLGDYKLSPNIKQIQSNSMMDKFAPQAPKFGSTASSFVFEHAEYLGDISGTSSFSASTYTINPANPSTFPWLSQMATAFETYKIEGMLFRFESTSGSYTGATTALGNVMAYIAYDVTDTAPTNKQILLQSDGVVEGKPTENWLLGVECDPSRLPRDKLYVGTAAPGTDARLNDFAKVVIATSGNPSTDILGELWIHYRVRFYTAKDAGISTGIDPPYVIAVSSAVTNALPLNGLVTLSANALTSTYTGTQITWSGTTSSLWCLVIVWNGGVATTVQPSVFAYTNCTAATIPIATGVIGSGFGGANTQSALTLYIKCFDTFAGTTQPAIALSGAGTLPTSAACKITLSKVY